MIIWIGIDDTDNLDSRGTGFLARSMSEYLTKKNLGRCEWISRHQLLVDPAIPYTSHNSSLCLKWLTTTEKIDLIIQESSTFLAAQSATGSDPGLCIVTESESDQSLIEFGYEAKRKVLTKEYALLLANSLPIHLSEHGGTGGGIIGALAGVGLSSSGNDGRFVWLKGIREMKGIFSAYQIVKQSGVNRIQSLDQNVIDSDDTIDIGEWFRPVLIGHQAVLLVEPSQSTASKWKIIDRKTIKARY
jgi:hypothetical protein